MRRDRGRERDEHPRGRSAPAGHSRAAPARLRVIAGELRGRKIDYNGDPNTRPMKERTRESVFSLLGGYLTDTFAIDLFGGTGILAIESVSRGADRAIILELASSAVGTMLRTLESLELTDAIEIHNVDTLRWLRGLDQHRAGWPDLPWVVFCCPPFRMWRDETERLRQGMQAMIAASPSGSQFVCETEQDFDIAAAMAEIPWDVRRYQPAHIAIYRKE